MGRIQDHIVKLKCQECQRINYFTGKNKKKLKEKLELKKHCPNCKKHTLHIEVK
ncbi:MAG: 50S ribosomal protein L33 [Patescibacteria group bacterium]|nr:50S ribosomal protein L33 [Patescibacteria group bacterium]